MHRCNPSSEGGSLIGFQVLPRIGTPERKAVRVRGEDAGGKHWHGGRGKEGRGLTLSTPSATTTFTLANLSMDLVVVS